MSKLALLSGCWAALGSVASKLAFGGSTTDNIFGELLLGEYGNLFRVCMFLLFLALNILMWYTFTKALKDSSTSVQVIVVNTAANFIISGLLGRLIFEEYHSCIWYCGLTMIIAGTAIIQCNVEKMNKTKND